MLDSKTLEKKTKKELIEIILQFQEKKEGTNIPIFKSAKVLSSEEIYKKRIIIPTSKDKSSSVKLKREK
jgi:hypothetical protein